MRKFLFILFGAPGSGKGFLGECLKSELVKQGIVSEDQIKYISTGDLLREEVALKTPLGLQIAQTIASGQLVSDAVVDTLVDKALQRDEMVMFLDGYPRTSNQLSSLAQILQDKSYVVIAIKRNTPEKLILERVSKRRVCKECKSTHSVDDGKCPKCGGESTVRRDDAVIEKRLSEYRENTAPLWNDLWNVSNFMTSIDGKEDAKASAAEVIFYLRRREII